MINLTAMAFGNLSGLMSIFAVPSILAVLSATKNSSSVGAAYRRFKMNMLNTQTWYQNELKPGTP